MKHLEDNEAEALWQYAQTNPILRDYLYHIPNGGKRNVREAARFKKQGVRAGVSDYHLPVPIDGYHGLWIELKAGKGKPTTAQLEWLDKMNSIGHAAFVCYGWIEARDKLEWYMGLG